MRLLFVCLAVIATCSGVQYDDLRVRFGTDSSQINTEYFIQLPRNLIAALVSGWRPSERPPGLYPSLNMYCPLGRAVCALYAPQGYVAGIQIALPLDEVILPYNLEGFMVRWNAPETSTEPAREFLTATQYYVTEESLKSDFPNKESTIGDSGVWVENPLGEPARISTDESQILDAGYTRQNCIPGMGLHYYYRMTPTLSCADVSPWFALTENGKLVGTGFQVFGHLPEPQGQKDWFERPSAAAAAFTVPHAPECLVNLVNSYGAPSLHIFYVSNPWTITCAAGEEQ